MLTSSSELLSVLLEYQEDLRRIIGHQYYSGHAMSVEEILSDVNFRLIKRIDHFVSYNFETPDEFKKFLCMMAIQSTKWGASGSSNSDKRYLMRKLDSTLMNDDGELKSTFDHVSESRGAIDPNFEKLNASDHIDGIINSLTKYNYFLTKKQIRYFQLYLKGYTGEAIGEMFGTTHQNVSNCLRKARELIKQYSNIQFSASSKDRAINKGHKAIKYLFGQERLNQRMC
jgi:predicted DNA-binding protein YlxM (UPF0122 family)